MALSRTWYTDANIDVAESGSQDKHTKSVAWGLKALLMGQITGSQGSTGAAPTGSYWTCISSSDGTTADGNDNWGSTYDASKLVRNSSGNSHSWIVLKSPNTISSDGPYYLLLDLNNSSNGYASLRYSKNSYTGGTNTTSPTSTSDLEINQGFEFYADSNTTSPVYFSITRDTNGGFYFVAVRQSTGTITFFSLVGLEDMQLNDTWRTWSAFTSFGGINSIASSYIPSIRLTGKTYNSAADSIASPNILAISNTPLYSISGLDANTGNYFTFPFFVYSTTTGLLGYRGRFPDAQLVGTGKNSGDVVPSVGNIEQCLNGNFLLPFGVSTGV
jgi:hypothetical protein